MGNICDAYGLNDNRREEIGQHLSTALKSGRMTTVAAAGVFVKLEELALKREEFEDKVRRLDANKPTEIIANVSELDRRIETLRKRVYGPATTIADTEQVALPESSSPVIRVGQPARIEAPASAARLDPETNEEPDAGD